MSEGGLGLIWSFGVLYREGRNEPNSHNYSGASQAFTSNFALGIDLYLVDCCEAFRGLQIALA
jgi:hypothetical protein